MINDDYTFYQILHPAAKFFHFVMQLKCVDQITLFVNDLLLIVTVEFHLGMLVTK